MPRKSQKAKLILDEKQKEQLNKISQSRKSLIREVQRANILLRYAEGIPITGIEKMIQVSRPGRFLYVHTPKYGSWLNLVETLFGKMARTFLKHIRVNSKQELKERILLGIKEINDSPVVHRWKKRETL